SYPGLAGEAHALGTRLLEGWGREPAPSRTLVLDALLLLALGARPRPAWLAADAVALVARLVAPLAAPGASVEDALAVARALAAALEAPALALPAEPEAVLLLDDLTGGEPLDARGADADAPASEGGEAPPLDPAALELAATRDDEAAGGHPLSADELRRLLEAGAKIGQGSGASAGGGLPITALVGKIPAPQLALHPALPLARARGARRGDPLPPRHERVHRRAAPTGGNGRPRGPAHHRRPARGARHHDRGARRAGRRVRHLRLLGARARQRRVLPGEGLRRAPGVDGEGAHRRYRAQAQHTHGRRAPARDAQAHRRGCARGAPDAAQRRLPPGRRLRRGPAEPRVRHPRHGGGAARGRRGGHHALLRHRRPRRARLPARDVRCRALPGDRG